MNCIWILILLCCCNKGNCNGGRNECEDREDNRPGRSCPVRNERNCDGPGPEIPSRRPLPPFSPDVTCGCDIPEL